MREREVVLVPVGVLLNDLSQDVRTHIDKLKPCLVRPPVWEYPDAEDVEEDAESTDA